MTLKHCPHAGQKVDRGELTLNDQAPVVIRREIEIFAPPEVIWEWIRRVDLWSDWNSEISSSWLIDDDAVGARFKWRKKLLGVRGKITSSRPGREWSWTGSYRMIGVSQTFYLDGNFRSTKLSTIAVFEGLPARLLAPLLRWYGSRWCEIWLGTLKTRLESQHERGRSGKGGSGGGRVSPGVQAQADRERHRIGI